MNARAGRRARLRGGRIRRPYRREPRRHPVRQARRHRSGNRGPHGGRRRPHPARKRSLPIGVNVLANAAVHALAVASAAGARFVRVNQWANAYVANEGLIEGAAARATRYRRALRRRASGSSPTPTSSTAPTPSCRIGRSPNSCATSSSSTLTSSSATGQRTGHAPISTTSGRSGPPPRCRCSSAAASTSDNVGDILADRRRRHRRQRAQGGRALVESGRSDERARRFVDARQESAMTDTALVFRADASRRRAEHGTRSSATASFARSRRIRSTIACSPDTSRIEYGFVDTAAQGARLRRREGAVLSGAPAPGPRASWPRDRPGTVLHRRFRADGRARRGPDRPAAAGTGASAARALPHGRRDGGLRGDPGLHFGGGVDVSDLVLDGRPDAVVKGLPSGTGSRFTPAALSPTRSHGCARKSMTEDRRSPAARQARLSALFEKALEAEIAFHDAAYAV